MDPDAELVGNSSMPLPTSSRIRRTEELRATVVDIRRFSIHDGGGIRTTVFLKGCSLACLWCQNPETISPRIEPVFFPKNCIDCTICTDLASGKEISRGDDGKLHVDVTAAGNWEAIIAACPAGALRWNATTYTISDLVQLLLRDRPFYIDGGGVTLSGGEPLFRPRVAIALLAALADHGIDTAIETALHVKPAALEEAAQYLNTIYADVKIFSDTGHLAGVGRGNSLILANLRYLLTSPHRDRVIMRTPLIPGYTTDPANLQAIGAFASSIYPEVRWELLNYNPLASAKYAQTPQRKFAYPDGENPPLYTAAQMNQFRELAYESGVHNIL